MKTRRFRTLLERVQLLTFTILWAVPAVWAQPVETTTVERSRPDFVKKLPDRANAPDTHWKHEFQGSNGSDPDEFFVYEPVAGLAYEEYDLDPETAIIRHKIRIDGEASGEGPLLHWDPLTIGLRIADGLTQLTLYNEDSEQWEDTEYSVTGSSTGRWLYLDVVRGISEDLVTDLVFLNGSLVASVQHVGALSAPSSYQVFANEFATVSLTPGYQSGQYPSFVQRALRNLGFNREDIASVLEMDRTEAAGPPQYRLKMPDDQERRKRGWYPDFSQTLHAGDLSLEEEAWFKTQTINRSYYSNTADIDASQLPLVEDTLTSLGGDYLPTLESRNWASPWNYANWSDNYVEKLYGYIVPEVSGEYTFYVSGDEKGSFLLSLSGDPLDVEQLAFFNQPTGQYQWSRYAEQASEPVSLEAGEPYYFEAWHAELLGNDSFAIAWNCVSQGTGDGPQLIPSAVISSYTAGMPGTYPRNFILSDVSHLPGETELPVLSEPIITSMTLTGPWNQFDGNAQIYENDFWDDAQQNWVSRYHAYNAGTSGLEWIWSNGSNFPNVVDMSNSTGWYWYVETSFNPQMFYRYDNSQYQAYYQNPTPSWTYAVDVPPLKWDFETGLQGWSQVASFDTHDWTLDVDGTQTSTTGPSTDHTVKGTGGNYLYLEADEADLPSENAILISPDFYVSPSGGMLHFYYHKYGSTMGSLHVDIVCEGTVSYDDLVIWGNPQTSSTDPYLRADLNLTASYAGKVIQIGFRGQGGNGIYGDMAIDDVIVYNTGADTDGDGATDGEELLDGRADPFIADSDSDGLDDAEEIQIFKTDPSDPASISVGAENGAVVVF